MFDDFDFLVYFGYLGSVLIGLSLMMSAIVKLRIINLLGAAVFSTYGFLIGALPVGFLNLFIALVDIYYLINIFSAKEYFEVLQVRPESNYLKYYCEFYAEDIKKFQPAFSLNPKKNMVAFFVLRNSVPAGLVIAAPHGEHDLFIKLDYAKPGYRDFKMGKYVFKTLKTWPGHESQGDIKRICSEPGNKAHQKYLKRMGFVKIEQDEKEIYILQLANT